MDGREKQASSRRSQRKTALINDPSGRFILGKLELRDFSLHLYGVPRKNRGTGRREASRKSRSCGYRNLDLVDSLGDIIIKVTTMKNEQTAPETKGVTVKLLAALDLGLEIEGMAGRQFRMRMVTIEPGGVFGPIHDHKDRPGLVYILQGTITDHRDGVAKEYGPGVGWPEDKNTTHWLENRGTTPAVEISVDLVRVS